MRSKYKKKHCKGDQNDIGSMIFMRDGSKCRETHGISKTLSLNLIEILCVLEFGIVFNLVFPPSERIWLRAFKPLWCHVEKPSCSFWGIAEQKSTRLGSWSVLVFRLDSALLCNTETKHSCSQEIKVNDPGIEENCPYRHLFACRPPFLTNGTDPRYLFPPLRYLTPFAQGTLSPTRSCKKHRKNCECCPGPYLSTSVY